jgi:hypothetical protein
MGIRSSVVVAVLCLTCAACGTTVDLSRAGQGGATGGVVAGSDGGLTQGSGAATTATTAAGSTAGATTGAAPTAAPGASVGNGGSSAPTPAGGAAAQPGAASSPAGPSGPKAGRGFDEKNVYIGIPTSDDQQTALGAAGVKTQPGDWENDTRAVVKDINSHGGILGRTVVPVFHDSHYASFLSNPSLEAQSVCTDLTQDHPVLAVANVNQFLDIIPFYSCLAHADTPIVSSGLSFVDKQFGSDYAPYLQSVGSPDWTRFVPVFMDRLVAQNYFAGWDTLNGAPGSAPVKVGLLFQSAQPTIRVFNAISAAMTARGFAVETYNYAPGSTQDVFTATANAEFKFHADGVTHVLTDTPVLFAFAQAAEQQHYRPRYALQSIMKPAGSESNMPAAQMNGALGAGWQPTDDVDKPSATDTEAAQCLNDFKQQGLDYSAAPDALGYALGFCDTLRLIAAAYNTAGGFTSAAFGSSFAKGAATFAPSVTFRVDFSSGAGGVAAVRDIGFDPGCTCLVYKSAPIPF